MALYSTLGVGAIAFIACTVPFDPLAGGHFPQQPGYASTMDPTEASALAEAQGFLLTS